MNSKQTVRASKQTIANIGKDRDGELIHYSCECKSVSSTAETENLPIILPYHFYVYIPKELKPVYNGDDCTPMLMVALITIDEI